MFMHILENLRDDWAERYGKTVEFKSLWQAEQSSMHQQFLMKYFPDTLHLFATVEESASLSLRPSAWMSPGPGSLRHDRP